MLLKSLSTSYKKNNGNGWYFLNRSCKLSCSRHSLKSRWSATQMYDRSSSSPCCTSSILAESCYIMAGLSSSTLSGPSVTIIGILWLLLLLLEVVIVVIVLVVVVFQLIVKGWHAVMEEICKVKWMNQRSTSFPYIFKAFIYLLIFYLCYFSVNISCVWPSSVCSWWWRTFCPSCPGVVCLSRWILPPNLVPRLKSLIFRWRPLAWW